MAKDKAEQNRDNQARSDDRYRSKGYKQKKYWATGQQHKILTDAKKELQKDD